MLKRNITNGINERKVKYAHSAAYSLTKSSLHFIKKLFKLLKNFFKINPFKIYIHIYIISYNNIFSLILITYLSYI